MEDAPDGSTGAEDPPVSVPDGDSELNPGVRAQFRATSPAPVSVDAPLFNRDPIDTQGLRYGGEVSLPNDPHDFVEFTIVPGEVDPYIGVVLDCGIVGDSVRALLFHEDGRLLETIGCGDGERAILLENASAATRYTARVEVLDASAPSTYALEIDGHCFQDCDYQPFDGT